MDLTSAAETLLQLLALRRAATGRVRFTSHATLAEIVGCLDADRMAVVDLLEDLTAIGWVGTGSRVEDNVTVTTFFLTDQGRHIAAATRVARGELGFDG